MSENVRRTSRMEPKVTVDGKFVCEADNRVFSTREDFDKHCSQAHMRGSSGGRGI